MLKKPLGKLLPFGKAVEAAGGRKIIAVGDEVVFNLLEAGVEPFIAVFDFSTLRKPVRKKIVEKINAAYPAPQRIAKPAGEISEEMFSVAKKMLKTGGALFVEGEEDLFALPFSLLADNEVILYGQPGEGCVLIEKGSLDKKKLWELLKMKK